MAIPETMSVVDITEPGPPEALQIGTRSVPVPGAGEVLIRVAAAGVNRADTMQRKGNYPPPPGASDIPGLEVSGTLAAVGERVSGLAAGDEVCALLTGGGYAEYCLAPAPQCLPIPSGVSLIEAAALPEAYATVLDQRPGSRPIAGRRVTARARWIERHRHGGHSARQAVRGRASSRPPGRRPSARPASSSGPSAPSTTARRTSWPFCTRRPVAGASTSFWT